MSKSDKLAAFCFRFQLITTTCNVVQAWVGGSIQLRNSNWNEFTKFERVQMWPLPFT